MPLAGVTAIGLRHDPKDTARLRQQGLVALPEDLGIRRTDASRELLAARSVADLVDWSGGLQPAGTVQELVMKARDLRLEPVTVLWARVYREEASPQPGFNCQTTWPTWPWKP